MRDLSIGHAAAASGVRVSTIRFYEERGLIPAPPRSDGGRRVYDGQAVSRLRFIHHARDLGFSLEDIGSLLALQGQPDSACSAADSIARRHLAQIDRRIAQLEGLRAELRRMTEGCDHGVVATCEVIESLSNHALCASEHRAGNGVEKTRLGRN